MDSSKPIDPPALGLGSYCSECGLRLQRRERFCMECGTETDWSLGYVNDFQNRFPEPAISGGALVKLYVALAMSIVAMIGSIGPWATILGMSINGTHGDGQVTLVLGLIGMVTSILALNAPRSRWIPVTAASSLGCAGAVAGYDLISIHNVGDARILGILVASPEWGIYLATAGGVIGAVAALLHALDV